MLWCLIVAKGLISERRIEFVVAYKAFETIDATEPVTWWIVSNNFLKIKVNNLDLILNA